MRAFLAVRVPEAIRRQIVKFESGIRGDLPVKWVKFENLHVTLKFLGEVADDNVPTAILQAEEVRGRFKPFETSLDGIGCFPDRNNPRVVWIGVKDGAETLTRLQKDLDQSLAALGFESDERFHPHLTIGRTKKKCDLSSMLDGSFSSEKFTVEGYTLFRSTLTPQGPIYEVVKEFNF